MVIQGSLSQRQLLRAHVKISGANQGIPFKQHPAPPDRKAACTKVKYENAGRNKFQNQQMECVGQERCDKSDNCIVDFL